MGTRSAPTRVVEHAAAFNAAGRSGEWDAFADRFAPDATMHISGVPAGPFTGRSEIARAYAEQPPTDTLAIDEVKSAGAVDRVRRPRRKRRSADESWAVR